VVTKKRVSAFAGSDLDLVPRAGEIDSLVLTGIATSGVVLSTLRQAADLDFGLTDEWVNAIRQPALAVGLVD
jgi:nicotinamidase-related amidase